MQVLACEILLALTVWYIERCKHCKIIWAVESISITDANTPSTATSRNYRGVRARLDISNLQRTVLTYYQQRLANSTYHSYNFAIKLWVLLLFNQPYPYTYYGIYLTIIHSLFGSKEISLFHHQSIPIGSQEPPHYGWNAPNLHQPANPQSTAGGEGHP